MLLPDLAADGMQHGIAAGRDQQRGADRVGGAAQRVGQAVAEQQTHASANGKTQLAGGGPAGLEI